MMDFIRARNDEQKTIRVEQITNAAAELYVEIGYDKITFFSLQGRYFPDASAAGYRNNGGRR